MLSYNSRRKRLPNRSITVALGVIATVCAAAVPSAQAETRLRNVGIVSAATPISGIAEYKVIRGNDGVFRASDALQVPIRIG
jgi:hypothetical protein